jgi:hypothetical protein
MGFKGWLARKTSSPTAFAQVFVSGLLEQIEVLTAAIVAFSGRKPLTAPADPSAAVFDSHFDLEQAGFECVTSDLAELMAPTIASVGVLVEQAFLFEAYRSVTAFLCLYSANSARKHVSAGSAAEFGIALAHCLAQRVAGSYGFSGNPPEVLKVLDGLGPAFVCHRLLNVDAFGREDGLGLLLCRLVAPPGSRTQYAFVAGSRTQPVGCAAAFVSAVQALDNSLAACAKEVGW